MSSSSPLLLLLSSWATCINDDVVRLIYCIFLITHIKGRTASDGEQRNENVELWKENVKSHDISWTVRVTINIRSPSPCKQTKRNQTMHFELISSMTWLHDARRFERYSFVFVLPKSERCVWSWWKWFPSNLTEKCNYSSSLINPFVLSGSVKCEYIFRHKET